MCYININEKKECISSLWKNEASDFTPWVSNNIGQISKIVGMELSVVDVEAHAYGFRADILASDQNTNERVIIENMYGDSDHKHVGQCLTYMASLNAKTAILICEKLRDGHRAAFDLLNQITTEDYRFYVIEIQCYDINNTKAYSLNLAIKPNEEQKEQNGGNPDYVQHTIDLWDNVMKKLNEPNKMGSHSRRYIDFPLAGSKTCWISACFKKRERKVSVSLITTGGEEAEREINKLIESKNTKINVKLTPSSGVKNENWKFWTIEDTYVESSDVFAKEEWYVKNIRIMRDIFKNLKI